MRNFSLLTALLGTVVLFGAACQPATKTNQPLDTPPIIDQPAENDAEPPNSVTDQLIGGQTDEHGCLGPAGYSWDQVIGACARSWEVKDEQLHRAAQLAVEYLQPNGSATIVEVLAGDIEGDFQVTLQVSQAGEESRRFAVTLDNWLPTYSEQLP
ncbi:MAG: hypothetical protein V1738_02370 [Patescibacteria group bacterium]